MKVGSPEFLEDAKRFGLTGYQYYRKLVQENILPDPTDVEIENRDNLAKKKGFKSHKDKDYLNYRRIRAERRKSNNKDVKSHKATIYCKNANIDTIKAGWIGKGIDKANGKNVKKSTLNDRHINVKRIKMYI